MVALQKWTVLPCYHEPLDTTRSCRNPSFCSLAACFSDSIMPGPPAHEMGRKTSLAHVFTCIRRGRWIRLLSEMTDASRSKADVAANFPPLALHTASNHREHHITPPPRWLSYGTSERRASLSLDVGHRRCFCSCCTARRLPHFASSAEAASIGLARVARIIE